MARKIATKNKGEKAAAKKTVSKQVKKVAAAENVVSNTIPSSKKAATKKMVAGSSLKENAITIRMYCHGLGDCFLLSFPSNSAEKPFRVLIDCGVLQGTPNDDEKLNAVAENICKDTDGKIDLLVVTHEHWDHISGFSKAKAVFEQIDFNQVWLSWAENPKDAMARTLKAELGKKKASITAALQAVDQLALSSDSEDRKSAASGRVERDLASTRQVMRFLGVRSAGASAGAALKSMSLGETMDWLRSKVRDNGFCEPGQCRTLPGVDGVKVYVLGPPKNVASIRKMDPTGDQGYRGVAGTSLAATFAWLDDPQTSLPPGPFDEQFGVSLDDAKSDAYFREHYGFDDDPLGGGSPAWRRIDDEWLGAVGRLALQLDIGINNTSLALAFELPDGRTLIFPGDAQIGNWLSWDSVKFKDEQGNDLSMVSKKLLNNAIFYKVGHHGSHNATRKVGGLEEMNSSELVAMIPTDQKFAETRKPPADGWKMPFKTLYEALKMHTDFRIARADFNSEETKKLSSDSKNRDAFLNRLTFSDEELPTVSEQPLYLEYVIELQP